MISSLYWKDKKGEIRFQIATVNEKKFYSLDIKKYSKRFHNLQL